jgi:hypothetical protein
LGVGTETVFLNIMVRIRNNSNPISLISHVFFFFNQSRLIF